MLSTDAYAYLNIDDPVCAWATYRGVLVSVSPKAGEDDLIGGISLISAGMMRSGSQARLNNELAIESVRRARHPVESLAYVACTASLIKKAPNVQRPCGAVSKTILGQIFWPSFI